MKKNSQNMTASNKPKLYDDILRIAAIDVNGDLKCFRMAREDGGMMWLSLCDTGLRVMSPEAATALEESVMEQYDVT